MNDLFVSYEIAFLLKEKGFNKPCFKFKNNISDIFEEKTWLDWNQVDQFVSIPLYQQVFDWFDEVHKIRTDLSHADCNGTYKFTIWRWNFDNVVGKWERISCLGTYSSSQERNNKAIIELIKLIP